MRIDKAYAVAAGSLLGALVMAGSAPLAQQHSYTPQQIKEGQGLYDVNCGRCHNNDGAGVTGIELFKQVRRANSDDDIAKLIQNGIPGTSMPPHAFTTDQALNVVAYLRSMVGVAPGTSPLAGATPGGRGSATRLGDPARGRAVFNGKGGCVTCHHAENTGGTTGPDLSATGTTRGSGPFSVPPDPAALEQSILDPNADIAAAFRMFQVTLKSGAAVRGTLLNQDTFSVQIRDDAQNLRGFLKSDLKDFAFLPSAMPSYRGRLTSEEVADVVSYLLTLKGQAQ